MATVEELQVRRAPIGLRIRQLANKIGTENRDFNTEERSEWDRINREFDTMTREIEITRQREESRADMDDFLARGGQKPGLEDTEPRSKRRDGRASRDQAEEVRALAVQAWCRRQSGLDLTDDHRRACKATGLNPNRRSLDFQLGRNPGRKEKRALSGVNPSGGAVLIPTGFMADLEKALKDYNGVRQVADVIRTESGEPIPWPTVNDTSNEGELIGENTQVGEQDVAFGAVNFNAYTYSSKLVKVPSVLLEDSAFNLGPELFGLLGERIGRAQARHQATGTGASQPQGVVTGSTVGKTAASSTAISGDEIIDLIHSVDPSYRTDPSFRLMFHDSILAVIRKLKDSQNRYLFEEGQNGAPDKIKGVRYVINQNMDSTLASGKKPMLAGPFRKYKIRDVRNIRLKRLEERYAEMDQVGFIAFMRSDAKLLDAGTHPIKHLLMP